MRVFHGSTEVTPDGSRGVPIESGSVTASVNSRVTRSATFTTDESLFPWETDDLLAPERARIQILTGIGYPDGSREIFPVFTGRIQDATLSPTGRTQFRADDLAADVIGLRFETPERSITGNPVTGEIRRFVSQVLSDVVYGTDDVIDQIVPSLIWDDDRGRALDELAASVQGRWYFLGDGSLVTRRFPYQGSTPVLSLSDGPPDALGGGLISTASPVRTRDGVANSVTVLSERIDGSSPIAATARDIRVTSPLEYGGLYGRVSITVRPQTPLGAPSAGALAVEQLGAVLGLSHQWTIDMVPDAALEPGDTVNVSWRGHPDTQVIDSITYPLTTDGTMRLTTRGIEEDLSAQLLQRITEIQGTV